MLKSRGLDASQKIDRIFVDVMSFVFCSMRQNKSSQVAQMDAVMVCLRFSEYSGYRVRFWRGSADSVARLSDLCPEPPHV